MTNYRVIKIIKVKTRRKRVRKLNFIRINKLLNINNM